MSPIPTLTKAFDRASREWSRDPATDNIQMMQKGEAMLFAAIDLICALEGEVDHLRQQSTGKAQAERLFTIARTMTALGLEGEDPDDSRVARLMDEAAAATDSVDEMVAWIAKRRR